MKMNETVNLDFVRWSAAFAVAAFCVTSAFADDDIYSSAPDDPLLVVVTNATTTAGLDLYRDHLKQYWTFDDASNMFANQVGSVSLSARDGSTVERGTGENAKVGDGAMFTSAGVAASENVIDGTKPFTIMFWIKRHEWLSNQHPLLFIGETPIKNGDKVQAKHFIRVTYGNLSGGEDRLYFWENQFGSEVGKSNSALGTADRWNHFALTCQPVQEGAVASNKYEIILNGSSYIPKTAPQNSFSASDYFFLGFAWNYQARTYNCQDMYFDEVMIFDKALSTAEINEIKELTQPVDFSANWHMTAGSGTLDILGGAAQNVTGYGGTVTTSEGLVLSPERNTTYAGAVSGTSLTLDAASSSVTQTLAGANSYVGDTHVKTGVLAVNPMASFPSLETPLVAYWPCDTLSSSRTLVDMSGNGNHLYPFNGAGDATIDAADSIVDGALYLPQTEDVGMGFSRNVSSGRLKGFEAGQDNSFTVSFWMRVDEAYGQEGPFSFSNIAGIRFNVAEGNTTSRYLYFGDSGKLKSAQAVSTREVGFGDGKWRHFALTYDKTKANGTDACYAFYTNGCFLTETEKYKTEYTHGAERFHLGFSRINGQGIKGALDDVVVLNGVSATDIAALYNWRRGAHEADGETSVLPDTTRVVVDAGATLFITNANESVRAIAGAGTIHIAEGSSLYARSRKDFTGTIVGGGTFRCPGLAVVIQ